MNNIKENIQSELERLNLKFSFDEKNKFFGFFIGLDNGIGDIKVVIQLLDTRYLVYAILNNHVSKSRMGAVAEFLHKINFGLISGNFEMDYSTGEIRYKTYVNCINVDISEEIINESISIPILMVKRFGDRLLAVMTGAETPEVAMRKIKE